MVTISQRTDIFFLDSQVGGIVHPVASFRVNLAPLSIPGRPQGSLRPDCRSPQASTPNFPNSCFSESIHHQLRYFFLLHASSVIFSPLFALDRHSLCPGRTCTRNNLGRTKQRAPSFGSRSIQTRQNLLQSEPWRERCRFPRRSDEGLVAVRHLPDSGRRRRSRAHWPGRGGFGTIQSWWYQAGQKGEIRERRTNFRRIRRRNQLVDRTIDIKISGRMAQVTLSIDLRGRRCAEFGGIPCKA